MEFVSAPVALAVLVTTAGVIGCLIADRGGSYLFGGIGKPAASFAFLALGLHTAGGAQTASVKAFVVALVFSLIGDMALMGRTNRAFLVGLSAFLLGHVAFVVAFVLRGLSWPYAVAALPLLALVTVPIARWLLPCVPSAMRAPVIAYITVIGTMVVCAIATHGYVSAPALLLAAVMFFVSDLAVARQKFVAPDGLNRYWGLPLYFGAQLIFAAHLRG